MPLLWRAAPDATWKPDFSRLVALRLPPRRASRSARPLRGREREAEPDAAIVRVRRDAVAPPHAAVQVPVVVAAAAQALLVARPAPRCTVTRHGVEIVRARVVAPFPDVAAHVVDAELVR